MPRSVLTIDASGTVGWAFGRVGDTKPLSGSWALPGNGDWGRVFAAYENELLAAVAVHDPDLIVIEAPLPANVMKGQNAAYQALGLVAMTEAVGYRHDIQVKKVAASKAREATIGTGRFPKGEAKDHVMAWCRKMGLNPSNHHAGDAIVLWAHEVRLTQLPIELPG